MDLHARGGRFHSVFDLVEEKGVDARTAAYGLAVDRVARVYCTAGKEAVAAAAARWSVRAISGGMRGSG